jgi:hypothetical protein
MEDPERFRRALGFLKSGMLSILKMSELDDTDRETMVALLEAEKADRRNAEENDSVPWRKA